MAVVPVSQIRLGDKVSEQVFTKRGSLLFDKGFFVTAREMEILRAFQVPSISVEGRFEPTDHAAKNDDSEASDSPLPTLLVEYENLLTLFRKVIFSLRSGGTLPLLELRNRLETLLLHSDHYQILTFTPRSMDLRDFLLHNSIMVAMTSYQLAKWHGLQAKDWIPVALGGLLHDIGNAKVDEAILEKKEKLIHTEQDEMRTHTVHGYQMLKNVAGLNEGIKLSALQHHEREDGSGYPLGVKSEKIHPYAKIISIADIYHAMTSPRFYKRSTSPYQVLEQLQTESFGKLDPSIVQTFILKVTEFNNGTLVRLNDERIGSIVFSDRSNPTRPWVNINGTIVNLTVERSLFIQNVIQPIRG